MSKLISELKGKICVLSFENALSDVKCEVIDVDDEWIKCRLLNKKNAEEYVIY